MPTFLQIHDMNRYYVSVISCLLLAGGEVVQAQGTHQVVLDTTTEAGNVLRTGATTSIGERVISMVSASDMWLMWTDPNGIPVWSKRFHGPELPGATATALPAIVETGEDRVVLFTSTAVLVENSADMDIDTATFSYRASEVSSSGELLWHTDLQFALNSYTMYGAFASVGNAIRSGNGDLFFFAKGNTGEGQAFMALIKMSPSGSVLWVRRINDPSEDFLEDVRPLITPDGANGCYVVLPAWWSMEAYFAVLHLNASGEVLWARSCEYNVAPGAVCQPLSAVCAADGTLLVGVDVDVTPLVHGGILRFNEQGSLVDADFYANQQQTYVLAGDAAATRVWFSSSTFATLSADGVPVEGAMPWPPENPEVQRLFHPYRAGYQNDHFQAVGVFVTQDLVFGSIGFQPCWWSFDVGSADHCGMVPVTLEHLEVPFGLFTIGDADITSGPLEFTTLVAPAEVVDGSQFATLDMCQLIADVPEVVNQAAFALVQNPIRSGEPFSITSRQALAIQITDLQGRSIIGRSRVLSPGVSTISGIDIDPGEYLLTGKHADGRPLGVVRLVVQ